MDLVGTMHRWRSWVSAFSSVEECICISVLELLTTNQDDTTMKYVDWILPSSCDFEVTISHFCSVYSLLSAHRSPLILYPSLVSINPSSPHLVSCSPNSDGLAQTELDFNLQLDFRSL